MKIAEIYKKNSDEIDSIKFSDSVACVYNPLKYAWDGFEKYLEKFSNGKKRAVFIGMNPGPWGMAQTGVPFGEVEAVKNFLCIKNIHINHPENEIPSYPVKGLECERSEISGKRLWGLFRRRYETAENFFAEHFVLNYCPLLFLTEWKDNSFRNLTPDKLKKDEREKLFASCSSCLKKAIEIFEPDFIIGIGNFAEARAREAVGNMNLKITKILHPSPASPQSNKNWDLKATEQLINAGVWKN